MHETRINIALIGAGRIAQLHAANIARLPGARLAAVVDVDADAATRLAQRHAARTTTGDAVFDDAAIDAVVIASSTETHAHYLEKSAASGKAVLCEKPIDLNLERACRLAETIDASGIVCVVGFNRRFDPQFRRLYDRIRAQEIGAIETVVIISRDPAPPPLDYIARSGGLFRDMSIHDLDMARWLLAEEISELNVGASNLVDAGIGRAGDVDSAVITLKSATGKLVVIHNSRRAVYGYDQRIEVFGSAGMVQANNNTDTRLLLSNTHGVIAEPPQAFFLERYRDAFCLEMEHFLDCLHSGRQPIVNHRDGLAALRLAEALDCAQRSGEGIVQVS